jgi:hypothetical protein
MTNREETFSEKLTERCMMAYTSFRGLVNVASRIWMVRDWAKAEGHDLVGPPQCAFYPHGGDRKDPNPRWARWGLSGPNPSSW